MAQHHSAAPTLQSPVCPANKIKNSMTVIYRNRKRNRERNTLQEQKKEHIVGTLGKHDTFYVTPTQPINNQIQPNVQQLFKEWWWLQPPE